MLEHGWHRSAVLVSSHGEPSDILTSVVHMERFAKTNLCCYLIINRYYQTILPDPERPKIMLLIGSVPRLDM